MAERQRQGSSRRRLEFGPYEGMMLAQMPSHYLRHLREELIREGQSQTLIADITSVLREKGADQPPGTIYLTHHSIARFTERVMGVGNVTTELQEQARRAWEEGIKLTARDGAERRRWRGFIWTYFERNGVKTLLTLFPQEEEEQHGERMTEHGSDTTSGKADD